ncbi:MAG: membrane protein insertion efficiency factor YidD [Oscillospiraceae bacterium]|jgi:putative membrane protein insertion efficiency factor|nr:membrane protein insertion efficiency factor YidD [Oscillospiraceae bacterium]
MKYVFIAFIKLYRITLSKIIPPSCRFTPSCSVYAITALERFGAVKGGYLSLKRIIRCNPFSLGGEDTVPLIFSWRKIIKEGETS